MIIIFFTNNFIPLCLYGENNKIMAKITIPYAVADFVNLRERGFYYVDKTDYIPKLEDYNGSYTSSSPFILGRVCDF